MDLLNRAKIIVDKHKGKTERANDWNNEMDILVKAAKIVQGHALKLDNVVVNLNVENLLLVLRANYY